MKTSMVTQDADTFVALGRALSLAALEGALDPDEAADLSAALVAGILTGCMDMETYARVHDALAQLLEQAFAGGVREIPPPPGRAGNAAAGDEPLGVYLEVVGDAWDKVSWDEGSCEQLKSFVRRAFDLSRGHFGNGGWYHAPLRLGPEEVLQAARNVGLMVVAVEGTLPQGAVDAVLTAEDEPGGVARVILGWGERRAAVQLVN